MEQNNIKTRADGSTDTAFYMAKGRQARSQAFHKGRKAIWNDVTEATGREAKGFLARIFSSSALRGRA